MEADGDGYLGRARQGESRSCEEINNLGCLCCSFSRGCLHHHFPTGNRGASMGKLILPPCPSVDLTVYVRSCHSSGQLFTILKDGESTAQSKADPKQKLRLQTPQELSKLKKTRSKPTPILHTASSEGMKQYLGMKVSQPLFTVNQGCPWRAVPCLNEMDLGRAIGAIPLLPQEKAAWGASRHATAHPRGTCQQSRALAMTAAPSLPELHRCDGARRSSCLGSLPALRALPHVPKHAVARIQPPPLMRWLQIRVNHLPAECCRGVSEFLTPIDTLLCTALSCSRPKLLHQMFCNKNPKPHESSRVSYFIITPNSGLPRVSVVL